MWAQRFVSKTYRKHRLRIFIVRIQSPTECGVRNGSFDCELYACPFTMVSSHLYIYKLMLAHKLFTMFNEMKMIGIKLDFDMQIQQLGACDAESCSRIKWILIVCIAVCSIYIEVNDLWPDCLLYMLRAFYVPKLIVSWDCTKKRSIFSILPSDLIWIFML